MWDWLDDVIDIGGDFLGGVDLGDVGDFVGDNKDWLVPAGKSLLGGHLAREDARDVMQQYAPLREESQRYVDWSKGFYDPTNIERLKAQEVGRLTEQATPLIEAAGYGRRAQDLRRGMGRSTAADKREQAFQRDVAGLFSDVIQPRALQNVLGTGQMMDTASKARMASMSGQPQFMTDPKTGQIGINPVYSQGQQPWYRPMLSSYLN
jgi:hypothetical protein